MAGPLLETHAGSRVRLRRILAQGGMGDVWEAELQDKSPANGACAVKILRLEHAGDARALERFQKEARILGRLHHGGIVRVLDHGRCPDGRPFIVMELIAGCDLGALIAQDGPLPLRRAARIVKGIAAALQAAHDIGIAHLDLKPSNVLIHTNGHEDVVKLVDFGISQVVGEDGIGSARPSVVGSLGYLAPERISRPRVIDLRSDQFSLAALAYELITGVPAFTSHQEAHAALAAALDSDPTPASLLRPDLPPAVDMVIATAMDKTPAERFDTISDFSTAFGDALETGRARRWPGRARFHTALRVALLLVGLEVVDFVLRVQAIGFSSALRAAISDSAKTVFHLVQLPMAACLLTLGVPKALLELAFRWYRLTAVGLALVLASSVTAVTAADVREAICQRLTLPEDVSDAGLRADLRALRYPQADESAPSARDRGAAYRARLALARTPSCRFFRLVSVRAMYSGFLTYVGLLFAALILFLLAIQLLVAGLRRSVARETLAICALVLSPWFLLRAATERRANFGAVTLSMYQPIVVALAAAAVALVLLVLGGSRRRRLLLTTAVVVSLSIASVTIAFLVPGRGSSWRDLLRTISAPHLLAASIAICITLGGVLVSLARIRSTARGWLGSVVPTQTQALEAPPTDGD